MRRLARWARRMADIIDPPPSGEATLAGAVATGAAALRPWVGGPYGDVRLPPERAAAIVLAAVGHATALGRPIDMVTPEPPVGQQPYCVACEINHRPPLHYHTL